MQKKSIVGAILSFVLAFLAFGAQAQTPYGAPLTLDQAKRAMAAAEAEARKNNWQVIISIVDSGGHLVMLQRMDNAQYGSIAIATDKAKSAAAFRRPTKVWQDLIAQGGVHMRVLNLTGDAGVLEGGVPIVLDSRVVGAIGVSGVSSDQDAQIATAGVNALAK